MKKDGTEKIVEDPISGYKKAKYTYADYLSFSFDYMVELIRGKIFKMSPAPKTIHQQISMRLSSHIFNELKGQKCQVFSTPFDVILPIGGKERLQSTTVVQPDIVVICNPEIIEEAGCFGVPDWIIEILSPHTSKKDLQLKFDIYEEAGVKEYWIVMPEQQLIEVFQLEDGKYRRDNTYVKTDSIASNILPHIVVKGEEVF